MAWGILAARERRVGLARVCVEQQLKERLVGAVVVVAVGVILIPVLLDGPAGSAGSRSIGLELPAPDSESRTHTIRLGEPREQPPVARPAPSTPVERSPERGSVSRAPAPAPEKQPSAGRNPEPAGGTCAGTCRAAGAGAAGERRMGGAGRQFFKSRQCRPAQPAPRVRGIPVICRAAGH